MQSNLIQKARLGRLEALAALRYARPEEAKFDVPFLSSRQEGKSCSIVKLPMFRHVYQDQRQIPTLAA